MLYGNPQTPNQPQLFSFPTVGVFVIIVSVRVSLSLSVGRCVFVWEKVCMSIGVKHLRVSPRQKYV